MSNRNGQTSSTLSTDKITTLASDALDKSLDQMDAATLSKLNSARQNALTQTSTGTQWFTANRTKQAVFASIVLLAIGVWFTTQQINNAQININQGEYIANEQDLEVAEDLGFIAWLMEQDKQGNTHAS